jgi:LuxR family maltose regulon positive regulatory protein
MVVPLLLKTKTYIPAQRGNAVSRRRLIDRLYSGMDLKLTLISAPPGYGKTTLLSEWVQQCKCPTAWLSLDEGDNDLARFLLYLAAALGEVFSDVGSKLISALSSRQPPSYREFLTVFINQINAQLETQVKKSRFDTGIIFILDDYHYIESQEIHDALGFLLENLPDRMHLLISTRADPPIALARLRGSGQLNELRQRDLEFSKDETAQFLEQTMRLQLSRANSDQLAVRTDGWIAGLQMAAISMRSQDDLEAFIHSFSGSNRYIMDYLLEEVLQHQPVGVQQFLLLTSILDRLCAPLCDALIFEAGGILLDEDELPFEAESPHQISQQVLDYLERRNLFLTPLDNERVWYRYHHLFAQLLRQRLFQSYQALVPSLYEQASKWFEENGMLLQAIEYAFVRQDFERIVNLIERVSEEMMLRSEMGTYLHWVNQLPEEIMLASPRIIVYSSMALLLAGNPLEVVEQRLQIAERSAEAGKITGELNAVKGLIAAYQKDSENSVVYSSRALELLPQDDLFFRSLVAGYLGLVQFTQGEIDGAAQALQEAVRISRQAGNTTNVVLALTHLGELGILKGNLRTAQAYFEEALEYSKDAQGQNLPVAGVAMVALGRLAYERNKLTKAFQLITDGIELVRSWGEAGAINGYIYLSRSQMARGDYEAAWKMLNTAKQLAQAFDAMQSDDDFVAVTEASLYLQQGDEEAAMHWIIQRGLDTNVQVEDLQDALNYLTLCQIYIAAGRIDEVLLVLQELENISVASGWVALELKILVLKAIALRKLGQTEDAIDLFSQAMNLAAPQGYKRYILDEGEPAYELLSIAKRQGVSPKFTAELLAEFQTGRLAQEDHRITGSRTELENDLSGFVEPLSERELEVLHLIAAGLSNREISRKLYLSMSTVKGHTYNIYHKLAVHSRTQAVNKARALGILENA